MDIKLLVEDAYKDKTLPLNQINHIVLAVRGDKNTSVQCHSDSKRTSRTDNVLAAAVASVDKGRRFTVKELATIHGLTVWVIHQILIVDLGLVKKVPQPALLCPER
jgi:hypothetical protein